MNKNLKQELIALVARVGLPALLSALSDICYDRSVRDPRHPMARPWLQMARRMATATDAAKIKGV